MSENLQCAEPTTGGVVQRGAGHAVRRLKGAAYLRPTIEIENRVDLSPVALGNGQMVVKDGAGATLYDTHFAVDAAVDTRVLVPVPVLASAARIQLLKNGLLQDELLRSATAPTVDLLSPTSGEALGASVTVQWDMQDPDPDTELFATVLYSPDGVRWEPMAVRTDESSLVADTTRMASTTDGIIQVRVSDGFTTTIAQVEHLKLMPNRLPDVAISAPTDGSTVSQYSNVVFSGTAYDPEDEFIGPTHLEWYSDLDGFIGTGESLNAEGPAGFGPYSIGLHRIELRAYDSTGQSASAYVYLTVQWQSVWLRKRRAEPPPGQVDRSDGVARYGRRTVRRLGSQPLLDR